MTAGAARIAAASLTPNASGRTHRKEIARARNGPRRRLRADGRVRPQALSRWRNGRVRRLLRRPEGQRLPELHLAGADGRLGAAAAADVGPEARQRSSLVARRFA